MCKPSMPCVFKWWIPFPFLLLLWLGAGGCTSTTSKTTENRLIIGLESAPLSLDPRYALDAASYRIIQLLFNGLVKKDLHTRLVPDLAERWETPDDTTYVFHLRPGVKFHDGRELTAEDVAFTFRSILNPATRSPKRGSYTTIQQIDVLDPYTVRFVLKEPFAPFLINMVTGIVPRHAAERADFARHPIGTGPFRFSRWEGESRIELKANEHYFEGKPKLDQLTYKVIPDQTVRVLELEKGSVDFLQNDIPPDLLPRLEQNPNLQVRKKVGTNYSYIGFNLQDPILGKRKVRQALAYAVNRPGIIAHILQGLALPAASIFPPSHWAYEPRVKTYPYDPAKARELLDEAGYPDPDGDGPLPRFSLTYKTSENALRRRIAEAIQEDFKRIGVEVKIRSFEWGTFFHDIQRGNFQLYSLTWVGVTDPDIFYYLFHSQSVPPNGANRGRYHNPIVDRLLVQGRRTLDLEQRRAIYSMVQKILSEDVPYISLWFSTNVVAMKKGLQGFVLYPAGDLISLKDAYWEREGERALASPPSAS